MPEPFDPATIEVHPEIQEFMVRHAGTQPLLYRDGEILVREDEDSRDIFVLLDGGLVVERAPAVPGTPPVILACITPEEGPAIVGEMAYLGALRRTATVRSAGASHVLRLEPLHIDRILEGCPMLTRVICRQFSRRLQETLQTLSKLQARFAMNPGRRMAQEGEVLFKAGDQAHELFQLMAGAVRLERDGQVVTLAPEDLPQGFLAFEAYLSGAAHGCTATVDGMAFLSVLGEGDRETVVRTFPDLALKALRAAGTSKEK